MLVQEFLIQQSFQVPGSKRKIQLCRKYLQNGYCRFGQFCFFAHGVEELQISQPILKSKKCRNFQMTHHCKYGDRCNFRHEKRACCKVEINALYNQYPEMLIMRIDSKRKNRLQI